MSKKLKAAFVKWKISGLKVDNNILYHIDDTECVIHSTIYQTPVFAGRYDTAMHVVYKADKDMVPLKLLSFNQVYRDPTLENHYKKYHKTVTDLYKFNGN